MRVFWLVIGLLASGSLYAEELWSSQRLYVGGGFGSNTVPESDEMKTGLQLFAGYRLSGEQALGGTPLRLSLEAGYMDTDEADHDGLWVTPVMHARLAPLTELLLRAGAERGDDDGLVYGAGLGYRIERNMAVRLEFVEHPDSRSLQLNVAYYPW